MKPIRFEDLAESLDLSSDSGDDEHYDPSKDEESADDEGDAKVREVRKELEKLGNVVEPEIIEASSTRLHNHSLNLFLDLESEEEAGDEMSKKAVEDTSEKEAAKGDVVVDTGKDETVKKDAVEEETVVEEASNKKAVQNETVEAEKEAVDEEAIENEAVDEETIEEAVDEEDIEKEASEMEAVEKEADKNDASKKEQESGSRAVDEEDIEKEASEMEADKDDASKK